MFNIEKGLFKPWAASGMRTWMAVGLPSVGARLRLFDSGELVSLKHAKLAISVPPYV
jgi:hypothetical protein